MQNIEPTLSLLRICLSTLEKAVEATLSIQEFLSRIDTDQNNSNSTHPVELVYEFQSSHNPIVSTIEPSVETHQRTEFQGTEELAFADLEDTMKRYNSCPISRSTFRQDTKIRRIIKCGHIFEKKSLEQWLVRSDSCPLCRCSILEDNAHDIQNHI